MQPHLLPVPMAEPVARGAEDEIARPVRPGGPTACLTISQLALHRAGTRGAHRCGLWHRRVEREKGDGGGGEQQPPGMALAVRQQALARRTQQQRLVGGPTA